MHSRMRRFVGGCIAATVAALLFTPSARAENRWKEVLLLTDVHFNPYVDVSIARHLNSSDELAWSQILKGKKGSLNFATCGDSESTTDPRLFESAMKEISRHQVAFTVLNGDLLVHEFQCRYQAIFPNATLDEYREFAAKTIAMILAEVRQATHGRPVYFALGNHDSGCGNYKRDIGDPFLKRLAHAVGDAAGGHEAQSIEASFARTGYYEVTPPVGQKRLSIIVADTTLWSRRGTDCSGATLGTDDGQLDWVRERSSALKRAGQTVWLVGHIPPGIDPRASHSSGVATTYTRGDKVATMLASASQPIDLALFGHTHMNEWRLFGRVPVRISPALSPSSGNRPSFTMARLNGNEEISDYTVFAFTRKSWKIDHSFSQSFGQTSFNAASLDILNTKIRSSDASITYNYKKFYSAGGTSSSLDMSEFSVEYGCALSSVSKDEFNHCVEMINRGK